MSNSHGQQPPTDPDPVFQFTGDLLERYEGLEVDDLKVCAKKYQKDFDTVIPTGDYSNALSYLRRLTIYESYSSLFLPSSFLVSMQCLVDAQRNWDELRPSLRVFNAFVELGVACRELVAMAREIAIRFHCEYTEPIRLTVDDAIAFEGFTAKEQASIQQKASLGNDADLSTHLTSLAGLIEVICDCLSRRYNRMMYKSKDGQWIKEALREAKKSKEIRKFQSIIQSNQSSMIHLLCRFLLLVLEYTEFLTKNLPVPASNAEVLLQFITLFSLSSHQRYSRIASMMGCEEANNAEVVRTIQTMEEKWASWKEKCIESLQSGSFITKTIVNPTKPPDFKKRTNSRLFPPELDGIQCLPKAYRGRCCIEDRFVLFSVSGDGVCMNKRSKENNSWYFFSLCTSAAPCAQGMSRSIFTSFIVPENGPSSLYCPEGVKDIDNPAVQRIMKTALEETLKRGDVIDIHLWMYASGVHKREKFITHLLNELQNIYMGYFSKSHTVQMSGSGQVGGDDSDVPSMETEKRTMKLQTAANSYVHQVLRSVLHEIREEGDRGFVVVYGDKLFHIRYGIATVRADAPAADEMLDSSGLHTSNSPCRMCNVRRSYFDKSLLEVMPGIENSQWKGREYFRGFSSALTDSAMDDSRRWINHLSFLHYTLRNTENPVNTVVDTLCQEVRRITRREVPPRQREEFLLLTRYCSLRTTNNPPYHPSSLSFNPPFVSMKECKNPTAIPFSNGCVNLSSSLGLLPSRCVCIDMMHTLANVVIQFLYPFFVEEKDLKGKPQQYMKEAKDALSKAGINVAGFETTFYWLLSPRIIAEARNGLLLLGMSVTNPVFQALLSFPSLQGSKTHTLHVLAFSFLPVILLPFRNHPYVRCITSILAVCYRLYYSRKAVSQLLILKYQLGLLLNEYETLIPVCYITVSIHYLLHLVDCILFHGCLKDMDCFPIESTYFNIKEMYLSTRNSIVTSFLKVIMSIPANLVVSTIKTITLSHELADCDVKASILSVSSKEVLLRTLFNYIGDARLLSNGSFRHITLWDIEMCTTVTAFCEKCTSSKEWVDCSIMSGNPLMPPQTDESVMRTKSDASCLQAFAKMCAISLPTDQYLRLATTSSCTVDGMVLSSIPYALKDLSSEILCKNSGSFVFLLDYNECVHLYALCGFFASRVYDNRYEQAWGYEVPTISVLSDVDTVCCRLVALNSPRMKSTPFLELLSVRRCIGDLLISEVNSNTIAVVSEKTGLFQMHKHIPFQRF